MDECVETAVPEVREFDRRLSEENPPMSSFVVKSVISARCARTTVQQEGPDEGAAAVGVLVFASEVRSFRTSEAI